MDVTLKCGAFAAELGLTEKIASRKGTTMPALTHVLLEAEPMSAEVRLTATDLEVGVRTSCPAQVGAGGALLLPASRLAAISKLLPGDADIRLASGEKGAVRVTCGNYDSRLQALPPEDFPALAAPDGQPGASLSGSALVGLIGKVAFAVVEGDQRYYLAGARLELTPGAFRLVATDSHRLAIADGKRDGNGPDAAALLTGKTLRELKGLFDGVDGPVTFTLGERHLFFSAGPRLLVSTLVEGQFPAYARIIPKGNDKKVTVGREQLSLAVRRVALATAENSRTVLLTVADGGITVSAASAEVGDATERVAVTYDGPAVTVRLNAQYVQDFLDAAAGPDVALELRDEKTAVLFRQLDETASVYAVVTMPTIQ